MGAYYGVMVGCIMGVCVEDVMGCIMGMYGECMVELYYWGD